MSSKWLYYLYIKSTDLHGPPRYIRVLGCTTTCSGKSIAGQPPQPLHTARRQYGKSRHPKFKQRVTCIYLSDTAGPRNPPTTETTPGNLLLPLTSKSGPGHEAIRILLMRSFICMHSSSIRFRRSVSRSNFLRQLSSR